jgi:PAS domain S-box-containing protein
MSINTNDEFLAKAGAYLQNAIHSMPLSLILTDADDIIRVVNRTTHSLLGFNQGELVGQPLSILHVKGNKDDLSNIDALSNHDTQEIHYRSKNGDAIPVLFTSSAIYDDAEKLMGIVCIAQDLTAMRTLETQLLQSEKMASIGQLAAGVAHEINNPMGFIYSNLGTLSEYIEDLTDILSSYGDLDKAVAAGDLDKARAQLEKVHAKKQSLDLDYLLDDIGQLIDESREGADRVRKIVLNLKEFSHVDKEEKMPANINDGVESTLNIVWNELKYKADVEREYGDIPEVYCYIQELNQVFMNLLVNAAHAIEGHGTIKVRTYCEESSVCVSIADTGKGMSAEVQKRIFEPFYTTKVVGEGTGLGLSIGYGIVVDKHGGQLLVDSSEGKGTTFTIKIPIGTV